MSFFNKLFGVPETVSQFEDKAKKKGINRVDIIIGSGTLSKFDGLNGYTYFQLKAGDIKSKKLGAYCYPMLFGLRRARLGSLVSIQTTIGEALKAAKKLVGSGLKVTIVDYDLPLINNEGGRKTICEAEELLKKCETKIVELQTE